MLDNPLPCIRVPLSTRIDNVEHCIPSDLRAVSERISRLARMPLKHYCCDESNALETLVQLLGISPDATYAQAAVAIQHLLPVESDVACRAMWTLMTPILSANREYQERKSKQKGA